MVHDNGEKCSKIKKCEVNGCSLKHHSILPSSKEKQQNRTIGQHALQSTKKPSQIDSSCNAHRGSQSVLYKIVPVRLINGTRVVSKFAYLDEGSGLTLLDRKLAEDLDLKGTPQKLCLKWTSGTLRHENDSMRVVLGISGKGENQHKYRIKDVRTVKSLNLPKQKINKAELVKEYPLEKIPFEDFDDEPRILIGLDNIKLGLSREYVEGKWTEPIASKTLLIWVVHGQNGYSSNSESKMVQHHIINVHQCQ